MGSTFELRQRIARLNRLDLKKAEYSALSRATDQLVDGMQTIVGMAAGGEVFFRARSGLPTKPLSRADLAAPPASLIIGYQRCNPPNVPMFYAASRRSTALLEIGVVSGQRVYLSQWIGMQQLPINRIFDTRLESDWRMKLDDRSQILHSYLEAIFTRRIHKEFSDEYKLTAAISQHLTTNFQENSEHDVRDDRTIALRYPSVVDIENSYNTVMHGDFAKERLDLLHVSELQIEEVIGNQIVCSITDNAFEFEGEKIIWSGDINAYPAPRPNGDAPFIFTGKKWRLLLATDPDSSWPIRDMIDENKPVPQMISEN